MTWDERIDNYARVTGFPRSFFSTEGGIVGFLWVMGNDYRVKSGYHGGYPAGYLKRIKALFPDKKRVLHVFSGKVDLATMPGDTVDINPANGATFVDDAQTMDSVPLGVYDLVLGDPPYTGEDADRYGTTMVRRNLVMRQLGERLLPGAHVVWLDQMLPMYRKMRLRMEAAGAMVKSTNHRFRCVTIFKRQ